MIPPGMEITEIRVKLPAAPTYPLHGFARIVLGGCLVIDGLRIVTAKNGLVVAFPTEERKGRLFKLCFPITRTLTDYITDRVLAEFQAATKGEAKA